MLAPLCLLIVLGLTRFDQGPVGTVLRLWLVERPASLLSRLTRGQILGVILVIALGAAVVALFEAEGVRLFAMAAPDQIAWVLMFDVTVLFDLAILALSLRAVVTVSVPLTVVRCHKLRIKLDLVLLGLTGKL